MMIFTHKSVNIHILGNKVKNCRDMKEYGCSPNFIVMWRQLVKELLHAILLSHRVHVGHLVVGQGGEEEVHLGSSMVLKKKRKKKEKKAAAWSRQTFTGQERWLVLINGGLKIEGGPSWTQG